MGCILETALPSFNEGRALTDFHCAMYHIHPEEWKSHFAHIHVCGSLLPKQLTRRGPATKFCWSLSLLCMESGSCAEDEHDWQRCPSVVYPESSASATAVPATGKEMESGPKKQGGAAATPGEREQERQILSLCMCVYRQNQSDLIHVYSDQIHNKSSGFTYASQKILHFCFRVRTEQQIYP